MYLVDERGQLYTLEGICAAILVLFSAYVVLQGGIVPASGSPSGTAEMQLHQIAGDALLMLDTPGSADEESLLSSFVCEKNSTGFVTSYDALLEKRTGATPPGSGLQFEAEIWYRDSSECLSIPFGKSGGVFSGNPAVRVSRFVFIPEHAGMLWGERSQAVLLEVLVWRG